MRMVLVSWHDATMEGGWSDREAAEQISGATVYSLGFFIAENADWIKLAQTTSTNQVGNLTEIPKKWILDTTEIGEFDESEMH
jgi:hypothetical protein